MDSDSEQQKTKQGAWEQRKMRKNNAEMREYDRFKRINHKYG